MYISTDNPRGLKAVAIATDAGQWLKVHTSDGRKFYGIPSSKGDSRYYLTNRLRCTCPDFEHGNTCKHVLAVRLHVALIAEESKP